MNDSLKKARRVCGNYLIGISLFGNLTSIFFYWRDALLQYQWPILFLWLTSVATLVLGFFLIEGSIKLKKSQIVVLGSIFIFSFLLRIYSISKVPILGHDEARDAGLLPQAFLRGDIKDFFGHNLYGIPNTFIILASLPHLLFGQTILSVRFFAVVFGSLAVVFTYLLAKEFFGSGVGLIASLIMVSYHVHLHFSRTEFLVVFDSFWACLIIWLLLLSIRKGFHFSCLLGLSLGLSFHFYQGTRAVVLFTVSYFLIFFLKSLSFSTIKKFFSLIVGCLIGLGPTLLVALSRPHQFWDTGNAGRSLFYYYFHEGIRGLIKFLDLFPQKFFTSLAAIMIKPIDFHYRYGGPFLTLPLSLFFVIGLVIMSRNLLKKENSILLFWVLVVILFNSAFLENINFTHRLLSLVPALIIITALGINKILAIFKKFRWLPNLFLGLLILLITAQNIKLYFFDSVWKKTFSLNNKVATIAGFYTRQFDHRVNFYFLNSSRMSWKSVPSWEYLSGEDVIVDLKGDGFNDRILIVKEEEKGKVFIVLPEREDDFGLVKQTFPDCQQRQFYYNGDFLFWSYECLNSGKKETGKELMMF